MKTVEQVRNTIKNTPARSAWQRGVKEYALEMLSDLGQDYEFAGSPADKKALLNGADNWQHYSLAGCALVYNGDIAERLCSPSDYKRSNDGARNPNSHEGWLDVQARALAQAYQLIVRSAKGDKNND